MLSTKNKNKNTKKHKKFYVLVGVTGHRDLKDIDKISKSIKIVLENIVAQFESKALMPLFHFISPLAEGADRLIYESAKNIFDKENYELEVVIPFRKDEYKNTFSSDESKNKFEDYLTEANKVTILSGKPKQRDSYEKVGRYVVEKCDVLIAIWNGEPHRGYGGTADIVKYARIISKPICWINPSKKNKIKKERIKKMFSRLIRREKYNRNFEYLIRSNDDKKIKEKTKKKIEEKRKFLNNEAKRADLSQEEIDKINKICNYILPIYSKASVLSEKYQRIYFLAKDWISYLSLVAISVVSLQVLFLKNCPIIVLIEVTAMSVILVIYKKGKENIWQNKWIDFRFLSERIRPIPFLTLLGIEAEKLKSLPQINTKINNIFDQEYDNLIREVGLNMNKSNFPAIRNFIISTWIDEQIEYHEKNRNRKLFFNQKISSLSFYIFILTFFIGTIHVMSQWIEFIHACSYFLVFLAIVLPAIGSMLVTIRSNREIIKNASKSEVTLKYLEDIRNKMIEIDKRNIKEFVETVKKAEKIMLRENEDWRLLYLNQEIETI